MKLPGMKNEAPEKPKAKKKNAAKPVFAHKRIRMMGKTDKLVADVDNDEELIVSNGTIEAEENAVTPTEEEIIANILETYSSGLVNRAFQNAPTTWVKSDETQLFSDILRSGILGSKPMICSVTVRSSFCTKSCGDMIL